MLQAEPCVAILALVAYLSDPPDGPVEADEDGTDSVATRQPQAAGYALRLVRALYRADRGVSVHPPVLLPGTVRIERHVTQRLLNGDGFARCYGVWITPRNSTTAAIALTTAT